MGVVIEFYSIPSQKITPPAQVDIAFARQNGLQVAAISLNSAALDIFRSWLKNTRLGFLFADSSGASQGRYVPPGDVPGLMTIAPGPAETEDFLSAVEQAVDEAVWRNDGLWIGSA
jgi:hypothetical protein